MQPLLEVKGLKKHFPVTAGIFRKQVGSVKALDGIDLSVGKGQVVGLVGESGSGKSTAGRCILRLIEPTSGSVHFAGSDLLGLSGKDLLALRRQMQIVFQDPYASLNPRKRVLENLGEPLEYHGLVKSPQEKETRVVSILEQVGLSADLLHRYPHELSGGQQQRIGIGRAISLEPQLIICDEAVSALDVSVQAQILNLLLKLKEELKLSYLFISHDLLVVRNICDHVVVLYLGKVMESGPTEQLFHDPKHPYTQSLLDAVPARHPHRKKKRIILKGEMPSPLHPPSGCPFRTRCPYAQPICAETPPVKSTGERVYHCIL